MKVAKSQRRRSGKTGEHPERSQTLEELEYREKRYRSIAESTPDGMVTIDAQGNIVLWNRAAEKIFGYTADEVIGKPLTIIMPERFHEVHKSSLNRMASGRKSKIIGNIVEMVGLRKDNIEFPMEISLAKWKTGEGVFFTAVIRDISERKQAEETLKESEAKHRTLFETMAQGIVHQNAEGYIFSANPAAERILGLTLDQMQGRTSLDSRWKAINEDGSDFPGDTHPAMVALKTGKEVRNVIMGVFHPGKNEYVWININAIPQFKPGDKKPYQVYTTFDDITKRKQAEEALKDSEEKFRSLVESTSDWIWETNRNGVYTYASPKIKELLGYEPEEIIGKTPFDLIPTEEANRVANKFKDIIKNNKPIERLENINLHKDGHPVILETSGVPIFNSKGQLRGYRGVDRDITARKETEKKLREGEERYHALFDRSLDLVYLHDFEGNFIDANNAALNLLGYKKQEIISLNFASLLPEEQMAKALQTLQELKKTGAQREVTEFRLKRKDGDFVDVETKASVIYRDGKPYAIQGIGRDITERKKMLDNLTITDRLAALGNMAGGFAHELNNPLTGVIGYSQLLLDRKDLPEDVRSDLTGIYEEAHRASEVIKNFMVFALKRPLQKQLCGINSFIQDVLKLRQYEQKKANIKVKTIFDPALPLVMAGPTRMHQVFLNIIINAEYFMFEAHKKGTLTISTEKAGEVVRTSFTDDGPGIPPENLGQIFNPFFTTKEVGQGIGLGLSICHSIVTEHGGNIYVESEPGKGATFIVELPISKE